MVFGLMPQLLPLAVEKFPRPDQVNASVDDNSTWVRWSFA